jgi:hemerythrin
MLWNSALETGIPNIDAQHKQLFAQVDVLLDSNSKERVPETLQFLGKYIHQHFSDEEALHAKSRYPKAEMHRKLHTNFVAVFNDMKKEYDTQGGKLEVLMKINKAVIGWLKEHIMVHDKEFAAFYKSQKR